MTDKVKRFIECIVPVSACNLKCHYCYIIQNNCRYNEIPKFKYSAEHIAKALSKKRMGGVCLINICGAGETLLCRELIDISRKLVEEGHYVNITTNGTITERFKEFSTFPKEILEKINFSFSLHYIELKEKNLLSTYFNNIRMMKESGASILVQFNMCDEYIPYLDEIKNICIENVGAMPQIALTRDEMSKEIKIFSKLSKEEYFALGSGFDSPLFDFTNRNFKQKQTKFCYAGEWSFRLDLTTGDAKRCYFEDYTQNWFEDINLPIKLNPVGMNCRLQYCINSSHFMALGNIPQIKCETYSELRDRVCKDNTHWQTEKMRNFLSTKLYNSNKRYLNERKNTFWENIFSFRKVAGEGYKALQHKVLTIFWIKLKFKTNNK